MRNIRLLDVISMVVGIAIIAMAFLSPDILDHNVRVTVICGIICFIPFFFYYIYIHCF